MVVIIWGSVVYSTVSRKTIIYIWSSSLQMITKTLKGNRGDDAIYPLGGKIQKSFCLWCIKSHWHYIVRSCDNGVQAEIIRDYYKLVDRYLSVLVQNSVSYLCKWPATVGFSHKIRSQVSVQSIRAARCILLRNLDPNFSTCTNFDNLSYVRGRSTAIDITIAHSLPRPNG